MISNRANKSISTPSKILEGHLLALSDPFHQIDNPEGYLNFGIAENKLIDKRLKDLITSLDINTNLESTFHYNYSFGMQNLREVYSNFTQRTFGYKFNPDNISIAAGSSAILEALAFSLFNKGDKILIPAPFYPGFNVDFKSRFDVEIVAAQVYEDEKINFTKLQKILDSDSHIKAILFTNPHNPLGTVSSEDELEKLIEISKKNSLEIITDEIYANSVFGDANFVSLMEMGKEYKDHIHHIYGLAKDFGLSGFKVGFFYTENKELSNSIQNSCYFYTVSSLTQLYAQKLLEQDSDLQDFFNNNRVKLKQNYNFLKKELLKINIRTSDTKAGLFTYADFSKYMKKKNLKAETELFEKVIKQAKINITPASAFGDQNYGNFRFCFSYPTEHLKIAINRLKMTL